MKKIYAYLTLLMVLICLTACNNENLPKANYNLYQVESVSVTAGDMQAQIDWVPSDKGAADEYLIIWEAGTVGKDGGRATVSAGTNTLVVDKLENNVVYTFSVQANYKEGLSNKVTGSCTPKTLRYPISDLAVAAGDSKVKLSWTKPLSSKLTGYKIVTIPGNLETLIADPEKESSVINGLTNGIEYSFSISAVYANGNSEAVSISATPGEVKPILIYPENIVKNQPCTFTANDMYFIDDNIQSITWNFGDGSTSTELIPQHSFNAAGKFTVYANVTYLSGKTDSGSIELIVSDSTWDILNIAYGDMYGYVKVSNVVFSPDGLTGYISTSTPNGHLFAFDVFSGKMKWVYSISTVTYGGGPAVGRDGTIYQCGTDKIVYAISPNGSLKWQLELDGVMGAAPAITSDGVLYCVTNGSTLYAINANTGVSLWTQTLAGSTAGAVSVDADGNIYAGTNTNVYAFTSNGNIIWQADNISVTERGSFAMNNGTLYAALRAKAGIAAINMSNGSIKWTYKTSSGDSYFPIVDASGNVYFTEKTSKKVLAINANGKEIWSTNIGAALVYSGLALADNGVLYVGTQGKASDGKYKILGIRASDGTVVMEENCAQQMMACATIAPDKRMYIGTIGTSQTDPGQIVATTVGYNIASNCWSVRGGNLQGSNSLK